MSAKVEELKWIILIKEWTEGLQKDLKVLRLIWIILNFEWYKGGNFEPVMSINGPL